LLLTNRLGVGFSILGRVRVAEEDIQVGLNFVIAAEKLFQVRLKLFEGQLLPLVALQDVVVGLVDFWWDRAFYQRIEVLHLVFLERRALNG
jgi:hypothetical protein